MPKNERKRKIPSYHTRKISIGQRGWAALRSRLRVAVETRDGLRTMLNESKFDEFYEATCGKPKLKIRFAKSQLKEVLDFAGIKYPGSWRESAK